MTNTTATLDPPIARASTGPPVAMARQPRRWWLRLPLVAWKYLVGAVLCMSPFTAVLVVGWTQRWMQRAALGGLWRQSPLRREGLSWHEFVDLRGELTCRPTVPNWILGQPATGNVPQRAWQRWLACCFGALWANLKQGSIAALNVAMWTLPATSLWLYAWLLGWNISFYKQYEQSHLGAAIGWSGILLFAVVMLYVPMAFARQGLTGNWKSFYDLRFNWRLVWRGCWQMLPWALLFAVLSFVVLALRTIPYSLGNDPRLAELANDELLTALNNYYFSASLVIFPAYVVVWLAASRVYARALVAEVAAAPHTASLFPLERSVLHDLDLLPSESPRPSALTKAANWTVGRPAKVAVLVTISFVWVLISVQFFVAQFFNYLPGAHWLNHPLVLLPAIRSLPPGLAP